jgi:hypothetical protein
MRIFFLSNVNRSDTKKHLSSGAGPVAGRKSIFYLTPHFIKPGG